ncbi:hypothetical protein HPP92_003668 [Vanilla planifolia]|uniref:Small auxin up regulated protein n=1 Tax=Vanilla planifolia TaxID=51239 RepID=A0A835RVQ8_VANPL|nr:hypothetical protein HPP92_004121 [Vanilla planifolia]KAG0503596.1 hypothetical protein HPP92_003668 [Vanilla planifolia]
MVDERKAKVKKGWLVVAVGLDGDECRRFSIPIAYLRHPRFRLLLEAAHEAYGYPPAGPLRLPCSVEEFLHLQRLIENESHRQRNGGGHHSPQVHFS